MLAPHGSPLNDSGDDPPMLVALAYNDGQCVSLQEAMRTLSVVGLLLPPLDARVYMSAELLNDSGGFPPHDARVPFYQDRGLRLLDVFTTTKPLSRPSTRRHDTATTISVDHRFVPLPLVASYVAQHERPDSNPTVVHLRGSPNPQENLNGLQADEQINLPPLIPWQEWGSKVCTLSDSIELVAFCGTRLVVQDATSNPLDPERDCTLLDVNPLPGRRMSALSTLSQGHTGTVDDTSIEEDTELIDMIQCKGWHKYSWPGTNKDAMALIEDALVTYDDQPERWAFSTVPKHMLTMTQSR